MSQTHTEEQYPFDELSILTSRIESVEVGEKGKGTMSQQGTGFLFTHKERTYLVTSRHIVRSERKRFRPDFLNVQIRKGAPAFPKWRRVRMSLYDSKGKPVWMEHVFHGSKADLVALDVTRHLREDRDRWLSVSPGNVSRNSMYIPLGSSLVVIGYPKGLQDELLGFPIACSGTLATLHGLPFSGQPYLLIAGTFEEGMSGSPVVLPRRSAVFESEDVRFGNFPPVLIGVHSGEAEVGGKGIGLNAVWYAGLITEIIERASPQRWGPTVLKPRTSSGVRL